MKTRRWLAVVGTCVLALTVSSKAREGAATPGQTPSGGAAPKVDSVYNVPLASVDGQANLEENCAACHGRSGKGDGPAASAMKSLVPDLTGIAYRRNGRFDALEIEYIIRFPGRGPTRLGTPAHGIEGMPIWSEVFSDEAADKARLRIQNLVRYLRSIQAAPTTSSR